MGMLVNLSLVLVGSISLITGFSFFLREKYNNFLHIIIPLMGVFACVWCVGYAYMGMTGNMDNALIGRTIGLFGVIAFMLVDFIFVVYESHISERLVVPLVAFTSVFAVTDFILFSDRSLLTFIRYDERTRYFAQEGFARHFHDCYLVFLFVSMLAMAIYWHTQITFTRDKRILQALIVANCIIVASAVPDTLLPVLNLPSFPSSGYGAFLAFSVLFFVCVRMNAFNISIRNFSSYIYENSDANIIVFSPDGHMMLVNPAGRNFLRIDNVKNKKLSDLFEISEEDCDALFSKLPEVATKKIRLVLRQFHAICSLNMSTICDNYGDPYCTICYVYDLTKEEDMLQEVDSMKRALQEDVQSKTYQIEHLTLQAITTIANTIDAKDPYTKGHSIRVSEYSAALAAALGWKQADIQNLKYVALLHDIGKIGVPDNILNKPGKLTPSEFEMIKSHTTTGGEILKDISMIPDVEIGARYHHERFDGKGYPMGLTGESIPEIARIICIADSYDAMSSRRVYRNSLSRDAIRKELEKGKGTQFDPYFTDKFLQLLNSGELDDIQAQTKMQTDRNSVADESNHLLTQIMENLEREKQKTRESDYLTRLLNRASGEPLIISSMAQSNGCLAFIDLDNLKTINDRYGHLAGDHALTSVADVLRDSNRNAIIARIGGDEFLYYMKDVDEDQAVAIVEGIIHTFRGCKERDSVLKIASLSIGLCLTTPQDTYTDIYQKTDKALYYVKQNGKDNYYFYHAPQNASVHSATDLNRLVESIMRQGSYDGSLGLEYREFTRIYEYVRNLMGRYGQRLQLVMITVESADGSLIETECIDNAMAAMESAIGNALRTVDVNTRFSSQQFLIILVNAEKDNVEMIMDRIFTQFHQTCQQDNIKTSYDVADLELTEM